MRRLENLLSALSERIDKVIPWLILPLAIVTFLLAVTRYGFSLSAVWAQEIPMYLNAIIVMTCMGVTWQHNKHVRVDIFYGRFSDKRKCWLNLLGTVFLLLPLCGVIIGFGIDYAYHSWQTLEKSPEPDGLPLVFILKSLVPLMAFLLALQGLANSLLYLRLIRQS